MIGLDTNVIARYITRDDPVQTALAETLIEQKCNAENPGFISHIVLCELCWVLTKCYKMPKERLLAVLHALFESRQLRIEDIERAEEALMLFEQTQAEFADCIISVMYRARGCEYTVTFDQPATRLPDMREVAGILKAH